MSKERVLKDKVLATYVSEAVAQAVAALAEAEGKAVSHWLRDAITEKASQKPWKSIETRGDDA